MSTHAGTAALQVGEIDLFSLAVSDLRLDEVSDAFAALLGRATAELGGVRLQELVVPEDWEGLSARIAATPGDQTASFNCRFRRSNGQAMYVEWIGRPVATQRWRVAGLDAADLSTLLADRRDLKARLDLALGQSTAAMWDLDLTSDELHFEPQAAEILGVAHDRLPRGSEDLIKLAHPDDQHGLRDALTRLPTESVETRIRVGQDHTQRHLSLRGRVLGPSSTHAIGLLLDITTEKALEEQLLRMSVSDGLTGIPNRRGFDQALRGEWRRCTRAGEPISVLMIDVDHFKQFNDSHGHLLGDQALIAVSRALQGALDATGESLSRYGGEEFAAVLPDCGPADSQAVADRMLAAARRVKLRQAPDWACSVSVGGASWGPLDGKRRASDVLARADEALYTAKRSGRDRACMIDEAAA